MTEASSARPIDGRDSTLDESGTLLGERYRLLRPLGEGGAGIVYAATDERIGAEVAIKVVRGSARRDEVTLARFHREARAAGKLGHPNIVRVTDFGTSGSGSPYVVMERLDGETLEARIARTGRVDASTAIDVHVQLADALAAAHAAGVLHRDVKPANVFLMQLATGKLLVKLLDFGLAELYEEPGSPRLTERGLLVGSLAYLAPERIAGGAADERSDVYAIGASLYESLTGEPPFSAPNSMMLRARILEGATPPLEASLEGVEPALAEIVRLCLLSDREARLPTAAEVRRRLLVIGEPVSSRPPARVSSEASAPPVPAVASATPRLKHALVASIAIALLAAVVVALSNSSPASIPSGATTSDAAPLDTTRVEPTLVEPTRAAPAAAPAATVGTLATTSRSRSTVDPLVTAPPATVAETPRAQPARAQRASSPRRAVEAQREPASPEPTSDPVEATPEEPPSRFDRVQEPDWGAPIPG